jgi:hypothetical protein
MVNSCQIRIGVRGAVIGAISLILVSCAHSSSWQVFAFQDGNFVVTPGNYDAVSPSPVSSMPVPPSTPSEWQITASSLVDVTGDGMPEWVLLVWRPWRDWRIQDWVSVPSPIRTFHDAGGNSCHLILLDPDDGHEIWAGSALPAPLLVLTVGDVDGDGLNEVVALEGDYNAGRNGPASHVDVWAWDDFGFSLKWRSPEGRFHQLELFESGGDGLLRIAAR